MKVSSHDNGRGRRIIVELGGVKHQWTVEFAAELRDALTRELSEQATPALTDREAMVWAAAFVHVLASGERSHVAARDAARAVRVLRDPETLELVDPSGLDLDAVIQHTGILLTEPVFVPGYLEPDEIRGSLPARHTRVMCAEWKCLVATETGIQEMDPLRLVVVGP